MFIFDDIKQLKVYIFGYVQNSLVFFNCVNFILIFFDFFEFQVKVVGMIRIFIVGGNFCVSQRVLKFMS